MELEILLLGVLLTIFLFFILLLLLLIYARWNYGTLETCGIPVVKPHLFLGSNPNIHNEKPHWVDLERSKIYGKVYGVYAGREPMIFISDPEILRIIQTRDFNHFRNHRKVGADEHFVWAETADFYDDEKWKIARSYLSPHFTISKVRGKTSQVSAIAKEYVDFLRNTNKTSDKIQIDFRSFMPALSMEIMGNCLCGIQVKDARDPENPMVKTLIKAFESLGGEESFTWYDTLKNSFPFLSIFSKKFPTDDLDRFANTIKEIMDNRRSTGAFKGDLIDSMIQMIKESKNNPTYTSLGITEKSGIAQIFGGIFAGHDSICTTITILTYYLAVNSKTIQSKVLQELDEVLLKYEGVIDWDSVEELKYLEACIEESLRIVPAFFRIDRKCTKDWKFENIQIKKGTTVMIPLWAMHRDPNYFPNPEEFIPERFLGDQRSKINRYAFGTFGNGPRMCLGIKMTLVFLKIIMAHFLSEFKLEVREDTKLVDRKGSPTFVTYEPILLDLVKREK